MILHSNRIGSNPWKVAIILEELGLPYEHNFIAFKDMKVEWYEALNPNARVPTLEDPNTNVTIWESGAIIDYLIDHYDKDAKLHYQSLAEKYKTRSWEHFQMSGQGPSWGQMVWFRTFHPEKLPSAIERYEKESLRIIGVIDSHLAKQGMPYLVGDRVTYADLMFLCWTYVFDERYPGEYDLGRFGAYNAWVARLKERPAAKKVWAEWATAKAG